MAPGNHHEAPATFDRGVAVTSESRKILLVDDDSSMRVAIARLLRVAGLECQTYASAEDLLADEAAALAACVISDQRLPVMSGLELLTTLRARGWPPVIMITAFNTPGQREEALRRGATAYLVKPFIGTELLDAVKLVIGPNPIG
jgi:FixJ family two-component response regulator